MADDGNQQRKPDFKTAIEDIKALATVLTREAEDILGRRTAQVLGILVLLVAVVGTLLAFLNWYVAPSGATQKQALVVTLAQILGGTALLSGLYFTWRTLQLNREGQITERFTRAIDQLSKTDDKDKKIEEIRLGGIYALERIAVEDPDNYHWPIMQVFAAYLRTHAGWQGNRFRVIKPAADIQTVLAVVGHRSRYYEAGENEGLVLYETDFSNYQFPPGAHLEGVWLANAHFESADLSEAKLKKADLRGAHLEGAFLWGADLKKAELSGAHLEGAYLEGADLQEANLANAHLTATYIHGANFQGVKNLDRKRLEEANGDYLPTAHHGRLAPGEYSIKVWKTLLYFRNLGEVWIPGKEWYSTLFLPYAISLTPEGVYFGGSASSGVHFFSGPWVCDPQRPKEGITLERAPKGMVEWVAWFEKHPHLRLTRADYEWKNLSGSASGRQFDVEVKPDAPDDEMIPGLEAPSVPIFPSSPRSNRFTLLKGKRMRVIVLEHEDETMVVFNVSPLVEFDQFKDRVEREVLATMHWPCIGA
jgi:hypothetical protein